MDVKEKGALVREKARRKLTRNCRFCMEFDYVIHAQHVVSFSDLPAEAKVILADLACAHLLLLTGLNAFNLSPC